MTGKILIAGGTVLSLDRSVGNLESADVLIEDGVITEVGASLRARHAERIDASEAIVMPGFVDTHRHAWHALFRRMGPGATALEPASLGPHYTPDHVYAATLVGLLGAAEAGITTVVDWADIAGETPYFEAALQAHRDSGLRTVFVVTAPEWDPDAVDPDSLVSLAGEQHPSTTTFAVGFGLGAPHSWDAARNRGLRIHAHAGAQPAPRGAVAELHSAGLLDADVTLVHFVDLDDLDLDAITSSGATVSLSPAMEMTDGFGWPPLQSFIDRGIRPGLGIGSEIEAPGDMFAQMREANSVQHARLFDLKLAGKGGVPNLLTTRDVIRYGAIDGANAIGLGEVTGSLQPGKRADVIVLRTDRPNIAPVNDPIGAVVWGMDTSNIDWVFADGRALVRNGELTADVGRARDLATAAHVEVAGAAGLKVGAEVG